MLAKPRDGSIIGTTWDNETQSWVIKVADLPEIRLRDETISDEVRNYASVYGMTVRLTRAAAKAAGATAGEKYAAIKTLVDYYATGAEDWEMPRGPVVRGPDPWVLQAIAALRTAEGTPSTIEDVKKLAAVSAASKGVELREIVAAWANVPKIREKAAELRALAANVTAEQVSEMESELGI